MQRRRPEASDAGRLDDRRDAGAPGFWDERVRVLFERWEREGSTPPPEDGVSVDWINDSAKPMFLALQPRRAAAVAVKIARETDRAVEQLSDDMLARNAAAPQPLNVVRAIHRREHLDEIDAVLR